MKLEIIITLLLLKEDQRSLWGYDSIQCDSIRIYRSDDIFVERNKLMYHSNSMDRREIDDQWLDSNHGCFYLNFVNHSLIILDKLPEKNHLLIQIGCVTRHLIVERLQIINMYMSSYLYIYTYENYDCVRGAIAQCINIPQSWLILHYRVLN